MSDDKNPIDINDINPVDYYNQNHVQDVFDKLLKIPAIEQTGYNSFTYVQNDADRSKKMFIIDKATGTFEALLPNGLNMPVGVKYTAFMMLQKFIHNSNFYHALNYVMYSLMDFENEYLRVVTTYYKKIQTEDRYGIIRTELVKWDRPTLGEDNDKHFMKSIPKYDNFCIEPDNINHKPVIGRMYNFYAPFEHKPIAEDKYNGELDWYWTQNLLKHIFGEHYELGLIYMKVLYEHPKQALPILTLISEERQTGKSTFIDYLSVLFGANTVVINPQDVQNQFNGSYADKNIIMIEESHFDSRQAMEKLKNLATQKKILVNSKFVQQFSNPFYGKIIITSNDENKFSRVDSTEIRYWVRKIPTLVGKENHNILADLTAEIPYFLRFLLSLPPVDRSRSRMVFTQEELRTQALLEVKTESRSELHKEIEVYLENHAMQYPDIKEFHFVALNVKEKFFRTNNQISASYINRVLKSEMKLDKIEKSIRFVPLECNDISPTKVVGKPFVWENPFYGENSHDDIKPEIEDTNDFFKPLNEF